EVNSKDRFGRTPQFQAAKLGYNAVVKLLLERNGIEVNSRDRSRRMPLLLAAELGHEAIVKLLLGY
ncbi:hypothetical protein K469DRAFT_529929, partial [Zopfia rhizophila CBS 207.26]